MANTYLTKTPGTSTNNNKFTMSVWLKRAKITGDYQAIYVSHISGGGGAGLGLFIGNDDSVWYNSATSSSAFQNTSTSRKLVDLSAWYHIVVAGDTTQSGTDKLKIWINNVLQTSFGNDGRSSFAGLSNDLGNATYANQLGRKHDGTYYLDGILSHFHFIDGTTYTPSTFGSTDATTGEWKINTSPSVTYGNNGFFMFKNDNSLNDDSGNGNNFALGGGTLTKTEDCPSDNFCTFNPLQNWRAQNRTPSQVLNKGNLTTGIGSSEKAFVCGSIGVRSGKYYWEAKSDGVSKLFFGVTNRLYLKSSTDPHSNSDYNGIYYYEGTPDFRTYGSQTSTTGVASITSGDILGFALDMDNYAFYIHKNGTYMNSGDPTSGSSKTGSIAALFTYGINVLRDYEEVFPAAYVTSTSGSGTASFNFGNGYFGTTAVSSAGTNASNIGIFEYDVPNGYTALSTKGLNE